MATQRSITAAKKKKPQPEIPNVGAILERLRSQHGMSVRDLAKKSGLSVSFIHAVERGDSDISLGRLARLAEVFEYDLGSLLGYTSRLSRPNFVGQESRKRIHRGKGVEYEALHLPGIDLDFVVVKFAPGASFKDAITHEGLDVVYVSEGEIRLELNDAEYEMSAGDCCVFSAAFPHRLRNDGKRAALIISVTTGRM